MGVESDPVLLAGAAGGAEALGLERLALHSCDPLSADDLGRFDYVLAPDLLLRPAAHAPPVLAALSTALAPDGVAFLAYPTSAGRAFRDELAAALRAAAEGAAEPARAVESVRDALQVMAGALAPDDHPYARHLHAELARAAHLDDHALLYEYVWPRPTTYRRAALGRLAAAAGLTIVADLGPTTADPRADSSLLFQLAQRGELSAARAWADVIQGRELHWIALAHTRPREPQPARLGDRLAAGRLIAPLLCPDSDPWLGPRSPLDFYTLDNQPVTHADPLAKATLLALSRAWPGSLSSGELVAEVAGLLERTPGAAPLVEDGGRQISLLLHKLIERRFVRVTALEVVPAPSSMGPLVGPLTKIEAERGRHLTGPYHDIATFDSVDRVLIGLLDGRAPDALREHLRALAENGTLAFFDGEARWPIEDLVAFLDQRLPQLIMRLHHLGVLA